nr:RNA-directed DNA polymerase, eukaryota [Tanacetum cinerariifolium]
MVNTSNKYDLLSNEYNAVFEESKGTGKESGRIKKHEELNVGDYGEVYEVHDETIRFIACTSSKVNELTKSGNGEGNTTSQMVFANAYDISLHGVLNKKRNQRSIRGIMVNGTWIDDPVKVKHEFLDHFRNRFDKPQRTVQGLIYASLILLECQN